MRVGEVDQSTHPRAPNLIKGDAAVRARRLLHQAAPRAEARFRQRAAPREDRARGRVLGFVGFVSIDDDPPLRIFDQSDAASALWATCALIRSDDSEQRSMDGTSACSSESVWEYLDVRSGRALAHLVKRGMACYEDALALVLLVAPSVLVLWVAKASGVL